MKTFKYECSNEESGSMASLEAESVFLFVHMYMSVRLCVPMCE